VREFGARLANDVGSEAKAAEVSGPSSLLLLLEESAPPPALEGLLRYRSTMGNHGLEEEGTPPLVW